PRGWSETTILWTSQNCSKWLFADAVRITASVRNRCIVSRIAGHRRIDSPTDAARIDAGCSHYHSSFGANLRNAGSRTQSPLGFPFLGRGATPGAAAIATRRPCRDDVMAHQVASHAVRVKYLEYGGGA